MERSLQLVDMMWKYWKLMLLTSLVVHTTDIRVSLEWVHSGHYFRIYQDISSYSNRRKKPKKKTRLVFLTPAMSHPWKINGWFTSKSPNWKGKIIDSKPPWPCVPAVNLQGCNSSTPGGSIFRAQIRVHPMGHAVPPGCEALEHLMEWIKI